jgi:hypothetical protein
MDRLSHIMHPGKFLSVDIRIIAFKTTFYSKYQIILNQRCVLRHRYLCSPNFTTISRILTTGYKWAFVFHTSLSTTEIRSFFRNTRYRYLKLLSKCKYNKKKNISKYIERLNIHNKVVFRHTIFVSYEIVHLSFILAIDIYRNIEDHTISVINMFMLSVGAFRV